MIWNKNRAKQARVVSNLLSNNERKNEPSQVFCALSQALGAETGTWGKSASLWTVNCLSLRDKQQLLYLVSCLQCTLTFNRIEQATRQSHFLPGKFLSRGTPSWPRTQNASWHCPWTASELPLTVKFAYVPRLPHPHPYTPLGPGVCHGLLQPGHCHLAGSRPYNRVCSLGGACAKCLRLKMTGCI